MQRKKLTLETELYYGVFDQIQNLKRRERERIKKQKEEKKKRIFLP